MNIFDGITDEEKKNLLNCLQAVSKTFLKDEIIFDMGDKVTSVMYIEQGSVNIVKDDYDNNKVIITTLGKDETFATAMVCAEVEESSIRATAQSETKILYLNFSRILSICSNTCPFHSQLIKNILKIVAVNNIFLQVRIELLSKKTLRERILFLLHKTKMKSKSEVFEIPYSREQMAEYIGADRSALSRELSKMKAKKIIDYHKNSFKLNY